MSDFSPEPERLQQQGLLRQRHIVKSPQGTHLQLVTKRYLAFCGNDYLGFANHPALVGPGDTVFSDRLNVTCLVDGARLSRAGSWLYPRADTGKLEHMFAKCESPRKLVATDAVFSMDGDIAPLAELLALCEANDAWLTGRRCPRLCRAGAIRASTLTHFDLASPPIIYMGTLGTAAGDSCAFVAGKHDQVACRAALPTLANFDDDVA